MDKTYPVYETVYGNSFGYSASAVENQKKMGYQNAYDLNPMSPQVKPLQYVPTITRTDRSGFRRDYQQPFTDAERLAQHPDGRFLWTSYGPHMDLLWSPYGPPMDPYGPYGHSLWTAYGPSYAL